MILCALVSSDGGGAVEKNAGGWEERVDAAHLRHQTARRVSALVHMWRPQQRFGSCAVEWSLLTGLCPDTYQTNTS